MTIRRRSSQMESPSRHQSTRLRPKRRGVVTFELIVTTPILLIFLAAVIEFGLILANTKQVALASRVGAKVAAEDSRLPGSTSDVNDDVETAVNRQLQAAGFGASGTSGVTLRHNVGGGSVSDTNGTCADPTSPALPTDGSGSVRVTVCVELSKLTPDLLSMFGFSTSGKTVEVTTTYPYEL